MRDGIILGLHGEQPARRSDASERLTPPATENGIGGGGAERQPSLEQRLQIIEAQIKSATSDEELIQLSKELDNLKNKLSADLAVETTQTKLRDRITQTHIAILLHSEKGILPGNVDNQVYMMIAQAPSVEIAHKVADAIRNNYTKDEELLKDLPKEEIHKKVNKLFHDSLISLNDLYQHDPVELEKGKEAYNQEESEKGSQLIKRLMESDPQRLKTLLEKVLDTTYDLNDDPDKDDVTLLLHRLNQVVLVGLKAIDNRKVVGAEGEASGVATDTTGKVAPAEADTALEADLLDDVESEDVEGAEDAEGALGSDTVTPPNVTPAESETKPSLKELNLSLIEELRELWKRAVEVRKSMPEEKLVEDMLSAFAHVKNPNSLLESFDNIKAWLKENPTFDQKALFTTLSSQEFDELASSDLDDTTVAGLDEYKKTLSAFLNKPMEYTLTDSPDEHLLIIAEAYLANHTFDELIALLRKKQAGVSRPLQKTASQSRVGTGNEGSTPDVQVNNLSPEAITLKLNNLAETLKMKESKKHSKVLSKEIFDLFPDKSSQEIIGYYNETILPKIKELKDTPEGQRLLVELFNNYDNGNYKSTSEVSVSDIQLQTKLAALVVKLGPENAPEFLKDQDSKRKNRSKSTPTSAQQPKEPAQSEQRTNFSGLLINTLERQGVLGKRISDRLRRKRQVKVQQEPASAGQSLPNDVAETPKQDESQQKQRELDLNKGTRETKLPDKTFEENPSRSKTSPDTPNKPDTQQTEVKQDEESAVIEFKKTFEAISDQLSKLSTDEQRKKWDSIEKKQIKLGLGLDVLKQLATEKYGMLTKFNKLPNIQDVLSVLVLAVNNPDLYNSLTAISPADTPHDTIKNLVAKLKSIN